MTGDLRTARLLRKRRTKWWREHIVLAYAVVGTFFVAAYLAVGFANRNLPRLLSAVGMTPSGVNFVLGVVYCGLGIWGLRDRTLRGTAWILLYALCLLGGVLTLLKAFGLV